MTSWLPHKIAVLNTSSGHVPTVLLTLAVPHAQTLAFPSGYWYLNFCWLGEGTTKCFCSYLGNKTQRISKFSYVTKLPRFQSINIFLLFLKSSEVVWGRKRKEKHRKHHRREKIAQRRWEGNKQQLRSRPWESARLSWHGYWPLTQGWSTWQGSVSSGKQKILLCCQPETFLIALLAHYSGWIQIHISPLWRSVTLLV